MTTWSRRGAWAALAALIAFAPPSAVAKPPATGAVQNFIALDEPKPAPEVSFADADGRPLGLGDFAGKVVLLNFWATWCGPCRTEMPELDALQAALGGESFEVVAVSGDREGLPAVDAFYADTGIRHLKRYVDKTMAAQRTFRALGLPTSILIDAQGREVGRLVGPAAWASPEAQALIRYYLERPAG
jgi:thiol-disulfide isomerase/thioredoxin